MSDGESHNPYQAPEIDEPPVVMQAASSVKEPEVVFDGMRYVEMYKYVFSSPNWPMNLLCGSVCQLIPIIGPIILMGYQFEIVRGMHLSGGREYPDFDFNFFVEYLKRGLWPFLCGLVLGLVMIIPFFLVAMLMGLGIATLDAGGADGETAAVAFMGLFYLIIMVMGILVNLVVIPVYLRAGLMQRFLEAFSFDFIVSFLKKTWKEMILGILFLFVTSLPLALLGLLAFCIGIYVAAFLIQMAYAHLYFQLYQAHIYRGGERIPIDP